jgi:hypothetical protein
LAEGFEHAGGIEIAACFARGDEDFRRHFVFSVTRYPTGC